MYKNQGGEKPGFKKKKKNRPTGVFFGFYWVFLGFWIFEPFSRFFFQFKMIFYFFMTFVEKDFANPLHEGVMKLLWSFHLVYTFVHVESVLVTP